MTCLALYLKVHFVFQCLSNAAKSATLLVFIIIQTCDPYNDHSHSLFKCVAL